MEKSKSPDADAFLGEIASAKERLGKYAQYAKKVRERLARTEKALSKNPSVPASIVPLLTDLRAFSEPDRLDVSQLSRVLDQHLQKLRQRFRELFPADLRQACQAAHVDFAGMSDGFAVGPFYLAFNTANETARLEYAKEIVANEIPLSATAVMDRAMAVKGVLLDQRPDTAAFASELNEAVRVTLARQNRPAKAELRVDLPLVFREMAFIRQFGGAKSKAASLQYSPARFVIELKQFIQSDDNMRASRPFRLEPAVIENTKNPKKSMFIPKDLLRGFGEGTYYQAIVLRQES
jgi:hypothetical protein